MTDIEAARALVAADNFRRIIARHVLAPGEKNRLPYWLVRARPKIIAGESSVRFALRLPVHLLPLARRLDVGPPFVTAGKSKVRPVYRYQLGDVLDWLADKQIRFHPWDSPPHYLVRRYGL